MIMPHLDKSKPGLHVRYKPNDPDLRVRPDDLAQALAELQEREAKRDPQFRPKHDLRIRIAQN